MGESRNAPKPALLFGGAAFVLACGVFAWISFRRADTGLPKTKAERAPQPNAASPTAAPVAAERELRVERADPADAASESREAPSQRAIELMKMVFRQEKEKSEARETPMADPEAVLVDAQAPLGSRRRAAWLLARRGDEAALRVLEEVFPGAPPSLKAVIAEALGHARTAGSREMLLRVFSSESDEAVLRGALRGIAALGGKEGVELLAGTLHSPERPMAVRIEAAEALGSVGSPEALGALLESYHRFSSGEPDSDLDLLKGVIAGLGRRDISETRQFFEGLLDFPGTGREVRLASLEALEQASGEVGPFLVKYLKDDDPDVRAAAAWSLAMAEEPGSVSQDLIDLIRQEGSPEVRARIYQALENQEDVDTEAVLERALSETDPGARLGASSFLAQRIAMGAGGAVREQFDSTMVPELVEVALSGADLDAKLRAVLALRQARTEASFEALREIANRSPEARIVQAARTGLERR